MTLNSPEDSSEANKKAGSLNLTDELLRDKIVTSFDVYDRNTHFDIILELNDYYHKKKIVFSTGKAWDLFIKSAGIRLGLHKIKYDHIIHILDTVYRNYVKLEDYHLKKYFDEFYDEYYENLVDSLANSDSENSKESLINGDDYQLINEYIIDLIASKYTCIKDRRVYNTILDQHDRKINPIIITSEHTKKSEHIKRIINKYDVATQQKIFRKIVMDEYGRDLGGCKLEIQWSIDDES
jgi:hypothetical protein